MLRCQLGETAVGRLPHLFIDQPELVRLCIGQLLHAARLALLHLVEHGALGARHFGVRQSRLLSHDR